MKGNLKAAVYLVVVLAPWLVASCTGGVDAGSNLPTGLEATAREFRLSSGEQRYNLAKKIATLLPRCEERLISSNGFGRIISYDADRPSYVLSAESLKRLLGPPSRSTGTGEDGGLDFSAGESASPAWRYTLYVVITHGKVVRANISAMDLSSGSRSEGHAIGEGPPQNHRSAKP